MASRDSSRSIRCAKSSIVPSSSGEQQAAAGCTATGAYNRHLGARHLPRLSRAAQLRHRFVHEPVAMRSTSRELPAVRVERQLATEADALSAVNEILALADTAETEGLDPRQAVEAEPVVEQ